MTSNEGVNPQGWPVTLLSVFLSLYLLVSTSETQGLLTVQQAVPFDILKKTQGEKAQNPREKLDNSRFGQIFYIVIKSYILVTFACFIGKALFFTKERCFQNFIFSSKTQGNANYNVQILNYFLKSQGKNSFFGNSIIPYCRNQVKRTSLLCSVLCY